MHHRSEDRVHSNMIIYEKNVNQNAMPKQKELPQMHTTNGLLIINTF